MNERSEFTHKEPKVHPKDNCVQNPRKRMETFKGYSRTQEDKELIGLLKESLCVLGWKPSLQEQSRGSSVVKGILLFLKGKLLRTTKELMSIQKTTESMSPEEQMGLLMKQNELLGQQNAIIGSLSILSAVSDMKGLLNKSLILSGLVTK